MPLIWGCSGFLVVVSCFDVERLYNEHNSLVISKDEDLLCEPHPV